MVNELIADQRCLLSSAKVFINSPSSTKWRGECMRMGEIAVCFIILVSSLNNSSQSWSYYSPHQGSDGIHEPPATQEGGTKEHLLHSCQAHPMPVEILRIQLQVHFFHSFIEPQYPSCFITMGDIILNMTGPCPQAV